MISARTSVGLDRLRVRVPLGLPQGKGEVRRGPVLRRGPVAPAVPPVVARVLPMPGITPRSPARFATELAAAVPDLRRVARRQVGNPATADDLVQMTCLRALERQHQFVAGTNLVGWLCTILRNLHRDELRRWRHETTAQKQLEQVRPAPHAETPEAQPAWWTLDAADVRAAAAELPEEMRQAYLLYTFEGQSYVAIARRLGVPMATVATRLYRARLRLRELLTAELYPARSCAC